MRFLEMLADRLFARAGDLDIAVRKEPPALRKIRMRGATLTKREDDAEPDADLPEDAKSATIGHYAILLGDLGESVDAAPDQWYRFLSQAAIARSWLPGNSNEDLNLYLVGPPGSDVQAAWREVAAEIERDERVCRKLVWLPPASEDEQDTSIIDFLGRTFLARPWDETGVPGEHDIDRLRNLAERLTDDAAPRAMIEEWLRILQTVEGDSNELVRELTEALPT